MTSIDDILIEKYLRKELTDEERQDFMKRMNTDLDLKEKFELERQLHEAIGEGTWSFAEHGNSEEVQKYAKAFGHKESQDIKQHILKAQNQYNRSKKALQIRKFILYPLAAAVTFLLAFYGLRPIPKTSEELFKEYLTQSEIPTNIARGDNRVLSELEEGETYFNQENYLEAEKAFSRILESGYADGTLYIKLALSQIQLKSFEKATSTLDQLIASDLLDSEKGYWFKSLMFLAKDEPFQASEILRIIIDKQLYNHRLAAELLSEL